MEENAKIVDNYQLYSENSSDEVQIVIEIEDVNLDCIGSSSNHISNLDLLNLPVELLVEMFSFLPLVDIFSNATLSNLIIHDITESELMFQRLCLRYGISNDVLRSIRSLVGSWKDTYFLAGYPIVFRGSGFLRSIWKIVTIRFDGSRFQAVQLVTLENPEEFEREVKDKVRNKTLSMPEVLALKNFMVHHKRLLAAQKRGEIDIRKSFSGILSACGKDYPFPEDEQQIRDFMKDLFRPSYEPNHPVTVLVGYEVISFQRKKRRGILRRLLDCFTSKLDDYLDDEGYLTYSNERREDDLTFNDGSDGEEFDYRVKYFVRESNLPIRSVKFTAYLPAETVSPFGVPKNREETTITQVLKPRYKPEEMMRCGCEYEMDETKRKYPLKIELEFVDGRSVLITQFSGLDRNSWVDLGKIHTYGRHTVSKFYYGQTRVKYGKKNVNKHIFRK